MQVGSLFDHHQSADHFRRRDDPCQPQTGGEYFGEGAQVNHITAVMHSVGTAIFTVQCNDGRDMLTVIAQLTVGIIFDDRHPVFIRQFNEFLAPFEAEGRTAWVLKVWEDVNEFWSDAK